MTFKIGDRVISNEVSFSYTKGIEGTVVDITSYYGWAGICFDDKITGGHDCGGRCEQNHGFYLPVESVKSVKEVIKRKKKKEYESSPIKVEVIEIENKK